MEFMPSLTGYEPNNWLTVLNLTTNESNLRDHILNEIEKENIEARPVWKPMHLQPLFKDYEFFSHKNSISDELFETGICLPSGTGMTDDDIKRVVSVIKETFKLVLQ